MAGKNQHVIPHNGRWAVKSEGSRRITSAYSTKRDAIDAARDIAHNKGGQYVVHGPTGQAFQPVAVSGVIEEDRIREAVRKSSAASKSKSHKSRSAKKR